MTLQLTDLREVHLFDGLHFGFVGADPKQLLFRIQVH